MHDMIFELQHLALRRDFPIGPNTNTKLIVDDLFNFAEDFTTALDYMEFQFICDARR